MADYPEQEYLEYEQKFIKKEKQNYFLHISLFLITFITTTIAGAEWTTGSMGPFELSYLKIGLPYSIAILFIITCHEFGHYFAARYHKVNSTLPYYIPFPTVPGLISFGTMGAVIKTRTPVQSNKAMFDIGIAGPLAGFVACLIVLIYGFTHVPGVDYLLKIHPDYFSPNFGKEGYNLIFGNTLLFSFFKWIFIGHSQFFPPMSEIYHYPFLCVGWFGLFITAMNMIPVGQLDGGHIGYTMFGAKKHYTIAIISFFVLMILGLLGVIEAILNMSLPLGWAGWLFWALILYFIIKLKHPPVAEENELNPFRKFLGYFSYFIFLISFSPAPIILLGPK